MSPRTLLAAMLVVGLTGTAFAGEVQPRLIAPGVISSNGNEFGGSMSPDGNELYFSRSVPRSYMYAIFVSRKKAGAWQTPQLVSFSGHGRDFDPVLSPDGRRMVFISDRPLVAGVPKHDYDIWTVDRGADGRWGSPRNVGAPVNTAPPPGTDGQAGNEWFASLAADGTLYFASDGHDPDGHHWMYRSRLVDGKYQEPENLGPTVNADLEDGEPVIAPDQSFLLYTAHFAKGGYGDWDIYIAHAAPDGGWSTPQNLGPLVNTAQRDYSPRLEPDGHTLIFTSERYFGTHLGHALSYGELKRGVTDLLNGQGNLYEIDLRSLGLETAIP